MRLGELACVGEIGEAPAVLPSPISIPASALAGLALGALVTLATACDSSDAEPEAQAEVEPSAKPDTKPNSTETNPAQAKPEPMAQRHTPLFPELQTYLSGLEGELDGLPAERRELLDRLAKHVVERRGADQPARLLFICTHNSRRSHMGQLWAATAAAFYGVDGIETFSGGTEATAFNPRAVAAMTRAGFTIDSDNDGAEPNPRYSVRMGEGVEPMLAFSKTWEHESNPKEGFAAVMTCSQADAACPFVRGAALRVALPYDDPKAADDTPEEAGRYDERARQIATEMLYLFRAVSRAQAS